MEVLSLPATGAPERNACRRQTALGQVHSVAGLCRERISRRRRDSGGWCSATHLREPVVHHETRKQSHGSGAATSNADPSTYASPRREKYMPGVFSRAPLFLYARRYFGDRQRPRRRFVRSPLGRIFSPSEGGRQGFGHWRTFAALIHQCFWRASSGTEREPERRFLC